MMFGQRRYAESVHINLERNDIGSLVSVPSSPAESSSSKRSGTLLLSC